MLNFSHKFCSRLFHKFTLLYVYGMEWIIPFLYKEEIILLVIGCLFMKLDWNCWININSTLTVKKLYKQFFVFLVYIFIVHNNVECNWLRGKNRIKKKNKSYHSALSNHVKACFYLSIYFLQKHFDIKETKSFKMTFMKLK